MIKNKFRELETDRLFLKKISHYNIEDMYQYASDEEVTRYVSWFRHTSKETTRQCITFLQNQYETGEYYEWALIRKSDNKMIGTAGLSAFNSAENSSEIGYVIAKEYWNRGFATEALAKIIEFAFVELRLSQVYGYTYPENTASKKVMEKCGMRYAGTRIYALIKSEETIEAEMYVREEGARFRVR